MKRREVIGVFMFALLQLMVASSYFERHARNVECAINSSKIVAGLKNASCNAGYYETELFFGNETL